MCKGKCKSGTRNSLSRPNMSKFANDFLCGLVEMKVKFKVIWWVQNPKKGSLGLGLGGLIWDPSRIG